MHCRFIGQAFKGKRSLTIRQKGDFFYYTTDSDFMHRIVKSQYRTVQGKVRRIRQYEKAVELEDRTEIPIEDIVQILYNRF